MMRVMLLDDEKNILASLRRALIREPYTVEAYSSSNEALHRAREVSFNLVISDFRMPGMNGIEFLAEFKKLQPNAIRVILTGYADLGVQQETIDHVGVHMIINKPWDNDKLKAAIASALEHGALEPRACVPDNPRLG